MQRAAEHDADEEDADARPEEHRAARVAAAVRAPPHTPLTQTLFRYRFAESNRYKNGITYTEGQERHDPGETGVYKKDFRKAEVFAAPSVPNIRSNDSTIQVWGGGGVVACVCDVLRQIKMSDFRYVTTEYEDKLGRCVC